MTDASSRRLDSILIEPKDSGTGIGIGQKGGEIWAVSICCRDQVVNHTPGGDIGGYWACRSCGDMIAGWGICETSMVHIDYGGVEYFVARWVGVNETDVQVCVTV